MVTAGFPLDLENLENHGKPGKTGGGGSAKTWTDILNLEKFVTFLRCSFWYFFVVCHAIALC